MRCARESFGPGEPAWVIGKPDIIEIFPVLQSVVAMLKLERAKQADFCPGQ
jgi:hypothetical protein